MSKQAFQPAFPLESLIRPTFQDPESGAVEYKGPGGLTKREYFAAMAMQGLLAAVNYESTGYPVNSVAEDAVQYADALLTELEKP